MGPFVEGFLKAFHLFLENFANKSQQEIGKPLFVQRLRSEPWTYKSNFCFCPALTKLALDLHVNFQSFSVTNFLGF